MEKTWENFWATGKVEDYLTYRNVEKEEHTDGTVSDSNGYGTFCHANLGLRQKNNDFDERTRKT